MHHSSFCVLVASPSPGDDPARCAFYCHSVAELDNPERCFPLTAEDFARVNPNTGTAPIFRTRRDAALTTAIYDRLLVLVDRSSGEAVKAWPVKYSTMFHMTNDSGLFRTRAELEEREGAWPVGGNRFGSPSGDWVPLYEGKMVQAFDHRAANIVVNLENQHRPAQPAPATPEQHQDPNWLPDPQFWVKESETSFPGAPYLLTFKDVTATTNVRSMIAALIPGFGVGNTLPIVSTDGLIATDAAVLLANFNALPFDYVARQKIQGQHLNWFIVEQLPVVPLARYDFVHFGPKTAGEIVREAVLGLTYTAHDMAPFARDLGYLDEAGEIKPPFHWTRTAACAACQARRRVLSSLRRHRPRRGPLHLFNLPHRRTPGNGSDWTVPLLRPLPRLDQRAVSRPPGRGDRVGSDADKVALAACIPARAGNTIHDNGKYRSSFD